MSSSEFLGDLPTGRRIDAPERPGNVVGFLELMPPATAERVELARQHFTEVEAADYDHSRRRLWVHRASGRWYRRVRSDVLSDPKQRDAGIVFFVDGGTITFLRPAGPERVETQEVGSLRGGEVAQRPAPATSGESVIF